MTHREKYRDLVGLLEESGVLQHDEEWALRVQQMIKDHKKSVSPANPPPGTEPCGTHPHNDGLDEWRKP